MLYFHFFFDHLHKSNEKMIYLLYEDSIDTEHNGIN